jgi:hypothetical protein
MKTFVLLCTMAPLQTSGFPSRWDLPWVATHPWDRHNEKSLAELGGMLVPGVVPPAVCHDVLTDAISEFNSPTAQFSDILARDNGNRFDVIMHTLHLSCQKIDHSCAETF